MEYKYSLITLIIVIALICIFYPIYTDCREREDFISAKIPDPSNSKIIAKSCANRLAVATYANVVVPCVKIVSENDIIKCITGYQGYYKNVIIEPISEMFVHLKTLEDSYVGYGDITTTSEGAKYATIMTKKYSDALSKTLTNISNGVYGQNGFEQSVFVAALTQDLTISLIDGITMVYTESDSKPDSNKPIIEVVKKIESEMKKSENTSESEIYDGAMAEIKYEIIQKPTIQKPTLQKPTLQNSTLQNSTIQNSTIQNSTISVDSKDINNGTVKIYIDGKKLGCELN
jgi:hypothetical protein